MKGTSNSAQRPVDRFHGTADLFGNGLDRPLIAVGEPADFILTAARDFTELFSRPHSDRVLVRDGVALDAVAPSYNELDALEGLAL